MRPTTCSKPIAQLSRRLLHAEDSTHHSSYHRGMFKVACQKHQQAVLRTTCSAAGLKLYNCCTGTPRYRAAELNRMYIKAYNHSAVLHAIAVGATSRLSQTNTAASLNAASQLPACPHLDESSSRSWGVGCLFMTVRGWLAESADSRPQGFCSTSTSIL